MAACVQAAQDRVRQELGRLQRLVEPAAHPAIDPARDGVLGTPSPRREDACTRRFQVMPFRDPALFEQFNCKPLNAAAAPDASVPITPGETEEAPKNRRLSRFNEL